MMLLLLLQVGLASVYTDHRVACPGWRYDASVMAAAHRSIPCGSWVKVTNRRNGKQVTLRITDRGPCGSPECRRDSPQLLDRVVDLTPAAAARIGLNGLEQVTLEQLH